MGKYAQVFEQVGIDMIHYDVMDGQYVPNISLGTGHFAALREVSCLPRDLHLMTLTPEVTYTYFDVQPGDRVSFHPDTCADSKALLESIHSLGAKAGIVLSPKITTDYIKEFAGHFDFVLVMAVEPGFGGQKMLASHYDKLSKVKACVDKYCPGTEIQVDGNITIQNIVKNIKAGANSFVMGSAIVGKPGGPDAFPEIFDALKKEIEQGK